MSKRLYGLLAVLFYFLCASEKLYAMDLKCSAVFIAVNEIVFTDLQQVNRGNYYARSSAGKNLFLKKIRHENDKEFNWLLKLNKIGIGVKVYGIHSFDNQKYIVMDRVDGINTQMPILASVSFSLTKDIQQEIQRQARLISENNIVPTDLQFMITKDKKVILIDPELFQIESDSQVAKEKTERIVNQIFFLWSLEGKLD